MIRSFHEKDLQECKKIIKKCLEAPIEYNAKIIAYFRKEFNEKNYFKLRSGVGGIFVFDDGKIKGFGCADGDWIRKLFVDPEYQNQGIGTKLMNYLEETIKLNGFKEVFLYSYPNTKKLCLKRGFIVVEEKFFNKGGLNIIGIKMKKKMK